MNATCPFCGRAVDPTDPHSWQRVVGWERKRDAGGTNAIALRQPQQEWAHPACVSVAKDGLIGQAALL